MISNKNGCPMGIRRLPKCSIDYLFLQKPVGLSLFKPVGLSLLYLKAGKAPFLPGQIAFFNSNTPFLAPKTSKLAIKTLFLESNAPF